MPSWNTKGLEVGGGEYHISLVFLRWLMVRFYCPIHMNASIDLHCWDEPYHDDGQCIYSYNILIQPYFLSVFNSPHQLFIINLHQNDFLLLTLLKAYIGFSIACVFIGFSSSHHGYKYFCPCGYIFLACTLYDQPIENSKRQMVPAHW